MNLNSLALDAVYYASLGLDMMESNHLFPIPYHNTKNGNYDMTLMPGYRGIAFVALKYAVERPKSVTIELVYENDTFVQYKKGKDIPFDTYTLTLPQGFGERGKIIGGFGYIEYNDPSKNKLITMSAKEIEKRKPSFAAPQFWDKWKDEMYLKTIVRAVYGKHIPRNPEAYSDEAYSYLMDRDMDAAQSHSLAQIAEGANTIEVGAELVDADTGEVLTPPAPKAKFELTPETEEAAISPSAGQK